MHDYERGFPQALRGEGDFTLKNLISLVLLFCVFMVISLCEECALLSFIFLLLGGGIAYFAKRGGIWNG